MSNYPPDFTEQRFIEDDDDLEELEEINNNTVKYYAKMGRLKVIA